MKTSERIQEMLKDRRDYRQALIHKHGEIESKIAKVEEDMRKLLDGELVKQ